jgi:hypothetical protein
MRLPEYMKASGWMHGQPLELMVQPDAVTPQLVSVLHALEGVGQLTEQAIMALLAQAPIDPFRLIGPLGRRLGGWTLNPQNATLVSVLAKRGNQPVALCVADLISSRVAFVALRNGQLAEVSAHEPEVLAERLGALGSVERLIDWLEPSLRAAVAEGTGRDVTKDGGSR